MKAKFLILTAMLFAGAAHAALNVVATISDFGAIAEEIGADKIKVTTICKGTEDAHFVSARPGFIRLLNQADVLLEGGADLEAGWLPTLVNGARNQKIQSEAPGRVLLSRGITLLEVPTGPIDRSMGDVHPFGNPHFWLDPANGKIMANNLAEAFSRLDPSNARSYDRNRQKFNERLERKLNEWAKLMEPYRGTKVVTYHKSFDYLLARFGLELAGTIEPKPGIEPGAAYVKLLISRLKVEGVKLILIEPYRPRKTPEYVAQASGGKIVIVPERVGGHEKAKDFFGLFEYDLAQIAAALKETK
ncbi:MAG: zinc ABC transporter substrate-binding protein [Verrucomicrobia bacterium]|nr:zinc ABC transporter substrate-binding protein [Verrucomicrobiota bacterium]